MKRWIITVGLLLGILSSSAQNLPCVAPEEVGMHSEHLLYADDVLNKAVAEKEIPGAVLAVVRHGKMAYLKAYGNRAVIPATERMTTGTIFDMASCTKSMATATAAMILIERGKIRLNDAVNTYLPQFANWKDEGGKEQVIRIADLMTHTSGLPPYAPVSKLEKELGTNNPKGTINYICTCNRDFKPGSKMQYSCLNYITLQQIIEKVSGQSLREFAQKNIFEPLGMKHTDFIPVKMGNKGEWEIADLPKWGREEKDWLQSVAPTEVQPNGQVLRGMVHDPLARVMNGGISGNAGLFSSANDIAIFCAALQNGGEWNGARILSPLGVKAMRSIPAGKEQEGRTLGWDLSSAYASNKGDLFGKEAYGHTGYTGTSIVIDPETDTSVILLINAVHPEDKHSVVRLRSQIANIVASSIYPVERKYTTHYYDRFKEFMQQPPITSKDIVILGNSLTENGGDWGKRLNAKNVVNRGIIGDEVMGVYDRLHQILPGHPKKLFFMIGVNDISHDLSADSITHLIIKTVERIRKESPQTKLYLQSLLPINESFKRYKRLNGKTEMVPEINRQLQQYCKENKITFINLFPLFTEKGSHVLRAELATDGLHLNEDGYKIWVKVLKKYL